MFLCLETTYCKEKHAVPYPGRKFFPRPPPAAFSTSFAFLLRITKGLSRSDSILTQQQKPDLFPHSSWLLSPRPGLASKHTEHCFESGAGAREPLHFLHHALQQRTAFYTTLNGWKLHEQRKGPGPHYLSPPPQIQTVSTEICGPGKSLQGSSQQLIFCLLWDSQLPNSILNSYLQERSWIWRSSYSVHCYLLKNSTDYILLTPKII